LRGIHFSVAAQRASEFKRRALAGKQFAENGGSMRSGCWRKWDMSFAR